MKDTFLYQSVSRVAAAGGLIASLAVAPGCSRRLPERQAKQVTVAVVLLDQSSSTSTTSRCSELKARLASYLSLPRVRRLEAAALGTGDDSTAGEPVLLAPWSRYEAQVQLFAPTERREEERHQWLNTVEKTCQAAQRSTNRSPIYKALLRARQSLSARCAELSERGEVCSRQLLAAHTDLMDNDEPAIAARLGRASKGRRGQHLPTIDTTGLTLSVCGVSNHRGTAGAKAAGAVDVVALWKEVLGPSLTSIDASCPLPPEHISEGGRP